MASRVAKASQWLQAATAVTAEDKAMQLIGLYWAGRKASALKPFAAALLAAQQPDGAWMQHEGAPTDAYANGGNALCPDRHRSGESH